MKRNTVASVANRITELAGVDHVGIDRAIALLQILTVQKHQRASLIRAAHAALDVAEKRHLGGIA